VGKEGAGRRKDGGGEVATPGLGDDLIGNPKDMK
jgi:hypothetical protein